MRRLFFLEDSALKKNLLILVLVAIVCALAAQYLRQGGPNKEWTALRTDMVDALERFWNTRGHQAELLPADKGVHVNVQVVMPADTSARQQQWNFPLLRYVAQRNGTPAMVGLSVATPQGPLAESGSSSRDAQGAAPRPYATGGESIETHLELVRRQAQAWLDSAVGAGNALALVDGTSRQVAQPVTPGGEAHYIRPREAARRRGSESSNSVVAPQIFTTEYTTVLVLVVNGRAEGVEAKLSRLPELEQALHLNLSGGDSRRVVMLP